LIDFPVAARVGACWPSHCLNTIFFREPLPTFQHHAQCFEPNITAARQTHGDASGKTIWR
jgi:hypothetical protein